MTEDEPIRIDFSAPPMRPVRVAAVSYLVEETPHSIERNLECSLYYVKKAAEMRCDIVCLPEYVLTTNVEDEKKWFGEEYPGKFTSEFKREARASSINVIAPYLVHVGKRYYSQATVMDRKGAIAGIYRKVHPNGAEYPRITPGRKLPVIELDFGKIAIILCMDIYFPEMARIYAMKGAEILFWPTITHGPTQEALLTQAKARALDNSIILVESNLAGHPPYAPYAGRSYPGTARIIDASGNILAATGGKHGLAIADVDLDDVRLAQDCVLIHSPDRMREDIAALARMDFYAEEYERIAKKQKRWYERGGSMLIRRRRRV